MKNKRITVVLIIVVVLLSVYFIYKYLNKNEVLENKNTSDIDTSINTDNGDLDIDWSDLKETDIVLSESMTITEPGIYNLSGNLDGNITINTTGSVKLVLNNVNIKSSNGPAIIIKQAENTIIYLSDETTNTLEDSKAYDLEDFDINSVIYSKDDLVIDGEGTLVINSNYQDGIVSKDDLKIINGNYNINSLDDGIRGKDSVYILNGNFKINSGGDGIKATNATDTEKGYILIENGIFEIEAQLDGIQSETKLVIRNGTFDIKTGGGSSNSSTSNDFWGNWGHGRGPMMDMEVVDTNSAKGLKSTNNLVIENGTFNFNTSDDSIHSNNYFGLKNGSISISSGDDGIHADLEIIIDSGNIDIKQSYEGIEASSITINDGNIKLISSDDGINVAGGNDSSSMNRPGENNYSKNSNNTLIINNGNIYINSVGDGIDVNESAYMYGGIVNVDGPTNDGNGTLDYDKEFVVDGGTLIAVGSSGMLQNISSNKQYNVIVSFSSNYSKDTKISLVDSSNQEVITYIPSKSFSSIIISSPDLVKGKTYKILIDGIEYESFTISSYTTTIGSRINNNQPSNPGGHGGRR